MLLPLLWKDIRLNRYVHCDGGVSGRHAVLDDGLWLGAFTGDPETNTSFTERLSIAFPFSLLFLAIASAFIGGTPIAAEKSERTDRFLAYLPPTRLAVVSSKVLIALGLLLLAWAVPLVVYFCGRQRKPARRGMCATRRSAASLILFGPVWLISLFVRSSTASRDWRPDLRGGFLDRAQQAVPRLPSAQARPTRCKSWRFGPASRSSSIGASWPASRSR